MTIADRWLLPDGVEELLPKDAAKVEHLRRELLDLYQSWGYELVIPPLMEYTESLLVGLGSDIDLLTFRVTDQLTGRMMGLRADITPQAARIDAHSLGRDGVTRLCYAGSVLHTRPKAPLASRSPIQLGAELYGDSSTDSDLEIISLMLQTLTVAGARNLTLDLGHVGIYESVVSALDEATEQRYFSILQRKAAAELDSLLAELPLDDKIKQAMAGLAELHGNDDVLDRGRDLLKAYPRAIAAIEALDQLAGEVRERFPGVALYFDLAELRGYHYHTGAVFSALSSDCDRALASGGRYDDIGRVFGRARPATGFSIDLKALLALLPDCEEGAAILAPNSKDAALWQKVQSLRAAGEQVIFALPGDTQVSACDRELVFKDGDWHLVSR
ncbi:ATP phosphoribosyltransferase regulatory subunit [Litorivivens lipolytica]|uniref:ATP phosphoribosyltransferase regulatory subunit n=1 Tax=Litorivivens lipolytica TaxID=1524264 RepID=A0A7W4W6W4_9GAMM|nr:ATP phosphoribosyltransferase regulatory subunit [Litorivivens lipolytica]MBB3048520.1 ATP phosphoribosyltransferase regulatory subunit [Litorivivens lipolytica]